MIDLYGWDTGNTYRVLLALEEAKVPYKIKPIDLGRNEHQQAKFLEMNPLGQVPVIHDDLGPGGLSITLTQPTAILQYIAEKTGNLVPKSTHERMVAIEALNLVMNDVVAPLNFCFNLERTNGNRSANDFGRDRSLKALSAIEAQLEGHRYVSGSVFGIADCAAFPIINLLGADQFEKFPRMRAWFEQATSRASVKRALAVRFE